MSKIEIRKLSLKDGEKERLFLLSFPDTDEYYPRPGRSFRIETKEGFESFVARRVDNSRGTSLKEGAVPRSTFWILADGELAGTAIVRHGLDDALREQGGHIGIGLHPDFRRKGIGGEALRLLIGYTRSLGEKRILMTTHKNNEASRRMIEKVGGKLEKVSRDRAYYWID